MTRIALRTLLAVLVAAWWLIVPAEPTARADGPVVLERQGQITDRVDALGDRRAGVAQALERLDRQERLQLFVVYVHDFSGRPAQEWADATARRNGLGQSDALLAVATRDRQYTYWVPADSPLTDARLSEVAAVAIEPPLRQNDWAGAAIGAANGYAAALSDRPVPTPVITPGDPDPGGSASGVDAGDLVLPLVLVGGAGAIGAYAWARRRRRTTTRTTPQGDRGWAGGGAPAPTPLPELDQEARKALVETDDAVRTSQEELGFAAAQFGDAAARPFQEAVTYAKDELTAAFRLRQQLDDAHPEDDDTRRHMLDEILARCADANRRLDAEADAFDRLRALEQNAPQALAAAEAAFADLDGRVITTEATLSVMRERYAPSASSPVAADADQAKERLVFARAGLDRARTSIEADDRGTAAVHVRAVEGALDQAGRLMEAVDRRARELAEAAGKLPGALSETDSDLAEAGGLLKGTGPGEPTAALQGRIARAESVAAEVRAEMAAGPYDPIDALRRVEEADAALDASLAGARENEEGGRRARALLEQATLTARSSIGAAVDYITTHRGAVGSEARTRLAEAQRRLAHSAELAGPDAAAGGGGNPQAALAEAQQADALARRAQDLAEDDVRGFGNRFGPGGVPGAGSAGGGLGGAVLGGILLGGLLGGGRGGGYGGGMGGGFGGGPGSFGGGGTRGRMGGGRF
ncbi:TPM domain-containing protein [Streptomyces sp. NPDC005963]|uniref:TPM domain-containing protein n=1 Tax=Streptomyces sp. NPDC005963 TaxID=3156721 RepID=UPI0033F16F30